VLVDHRAAGRGDRVIHVDAQLWADLRAAVGAAHLRTRRPGTQPRAVVWGRAGPVTGPPA